jgi:hypothetical protein
LSEDTAKNKFCSLLDKGFLRVVSLQPASKGSAQNKAKTRNYKFFSAFACKKKIYLYLCNPERKESRICSKEKAVKPATGLVREGLTHVL